ncbi:DsrE/DsrF/DrsH-like family protein [Ferrovum sp.]|jgi:peroxiredoxin family protein|uniref:DsrE/DsrF/DrsH-like family protein n=1 Tax=Ferrovum sp. TaxID=2609467 RepID=UPI00262778EE|nr:DsrE/DsrF/DrsH-like family protein [Ferrovum sp.]
MAGRKICVVVISGTLERLQAAAMLASVAAVSGQEVMVFLSMNALPHFIKGATAEAPHEGPMGDLMKARNVPEFKTLFEQAIELGGARLYPCSMAMDVLDIGSGQLEDYLGEATGLTRLLTEVQDGQVWTF